MSELEHRENEHLSDADRAALDDLMASGLGAGKADNARAQRITDLLSLLGTPVEGESDRATRVDLAIVRARVEGDGPHLSEADRLALDRWVDGETATPGGSDERLERHSALAALGSNGAPIDEASRSDLIARTMAAVEAEQRLQNDRLRFEQGPELRGWKMRLADVISVAAMLLLCASVALPIFNGARERQIRLACMDNMRSSASAFGTYAGDHADHLPMATAGFGGGSWIDVGTPDRSNSANLYTVVRTGYQSLEDLACPGNAQAARGEPEAGAWDWGSIESISYSYRIMSPGGMRISVSAPTASGVVVTADRSPVTLRASRGQVIFPEANSPNHRGRGQHVLRLDGSTAWETSPVVNGDNMWLPMPIERVIHQIRSELGLIEGTEMPESPTDAFVGP